LVVVKGLNSRKDLNGKRGKVISYDAGKARLGVRLADGGPPLSVKLDNVRGDRSEVRTSSHPPSRQAGPLRLIWCQKAGRSNKDPSCDRG
jgi:hypothetical protein